MAEIVENLWSKDFLGKKLNVPKTILLQQAKFLEEMTKNILKVEVISSSSRNANSGEVTIFHSFRISAPLVGNYSFTLFVVTQKTVFLYPINISFSLTGQIREPISDDEGLKAVLKEIFNHPETIQILSTLIAQSEATANE